MPVILTSMNCLLYLIYEKLTSPLGTARMECRNKWVKSNLIMMRPYCFHISVVQYSKVLCRVLRAHIKHYRKGDCTTASWNKFYICMIYLGIPTLPREQPKSTKFKIVASSECECTFTSCSYSSGQPSLRKMWTYWSGTSPR